MIVTDDQVSELQTTLKEVKESWSALKDLPGSVSTLQDETNRLREQLSGVRRALAARPTDVTRARVAGSVSDECARQVAATFVAHCERSGRLEALCSVPAQRDAVTQFARDTLGLSTRTALSTTEIPLPSQYGSEIRELISEFGVVRRRMSPYPIGMGTARPARMGSVRHSVLCPFRPRSRSARPA
jgi:hypothetical protein